MSNETRIMKPLKDLCLMDDFLFSVAMEDLEFCKRVLEIILDKTIVTIRRRETQKEFRNFPGLRGIRIDVYIEDDQGTIYDVEMQIQNTGDLPKRSRYYQSLMDSQLLVSGEKKFNPLNNSYIIIITPFDLFGEERFCYTFENRCVENKELSLEDGTKKIFLNTKGTNHNEVSETLVKFLKYIENTTDEYVDMAGDEKLKELHHSIQNIKRSEEIGVSYMKAWEREEQLLDMGRAEGMDLGMERGKAEGKIETLLDILAELGNVPEKLVVQIKEQKDLTVLSKWVKLAVKIESIEEFTKNMYQ